MLDQNKVLDKIRRPAVNNSRHRYDVSNNLGMWGMNLPSIQVLVILLPSGDTCSELQYNINYINNVQ